jgi:hypothetical protein
MTIALSTDNGPHSAAKWAVITADQIVQYDQLDGDKMAAAQLLRARVASALEPLIERVQLGEAASLLQDGAHILAAIEVDVADAMHVIKALTDLSPWAAHFAEEAVQTAITDIIQRNMNTAVHIEKLWFCDRNPADPNVLAFKGT